MPDGNLQSDLSYPGPAVMPTEISKAIGTVMTQVKSLPKGERNEHGGYAFASIDDFLAFIGPLCSTAGLLVYQDEDSVDLIDRGGKAWMKVTYSFTLGHTSGVVSSRPMRRTVLQQVTGPQTTGSCQSYALKQFLRALFMIPTGDRDDSDYHRQQDMPSAAAPAPQRAPQRVEQRQRANPTPAPSKGAQEPASESGDVPHIYIEEGVSGLKIGSWVNAAKSALEGQPEAFRRAWLEAHLTEVDEVRRLRPEWADKIEALAIAPDLPAPEVAV